MRAVVRPGSTSAQRRSWLEAEARRWPLTLARASAGPTIGGNASPESPGRSSRREPLMSRGSMVLLDAAGRRRSPATTPGYLAGRAPHNKGMHYPPDPPRPEEIIVVMRQAGHGRHGLRMRALIAILWRGGLRISEALALNETDIDERRGSLLPRYAVALVMPSRPAGDRVVPGRQRVRVLIDSA